MSIWRKYLKEVRKEIGELGIWPPIDKVRIGSYGELREGKFHHIGHISDLGWSYETHRDETPGDLFFSSTDKVEVVFKAAGNPPLAGSALSINDAGFGVTFHSEGGVLFKANGVVKEQIKNSAPIRAGVLSKFISGEWDKRYVVITEVHEASSIVVLVSKQRGVKADLKVSVGASVTPDLAIADVEVLVTTGSEAIASWTANEGATPLVKAIGIRDGIMSKPIVEVKAFMTAAKAAKEPRPVIEVGPRFDGTEE
jgi:hypothetical protein